MTPQIKVAKIKKTAKTKMPKTSVHKKQTKAVSADKFNSSAKKITVLEMNGEKQGTLVLPEIFFSQIKPYLVHKVMLWQQLKTKPSTAHTKNRAERRGGGIKPWRQKGTGQARTGSLRSPIFRKGGVVFGPTPEKNFSFKILKKEKRQALLSVLSDKVVSSKLIVLDKLKLAQIKTKKMEEVLVKLKINDTVLLVIAKSDEKIIKSARNLSYLKVMTVQNLNILDLLKYQYLLTDKDGIAKIAEIFKK